MTDKELKRLKRADLLEMLIAQGRQMEKLEEELAKAREELEHRTIVTTEMGNIADAALKLNKVFEAAQAAAQQYVDSVREQAQDIAKAQDASKPWKTKLDSPSDESKKGGR